MPLHLSPHHPLHAFMKIILLLEFKDHDDNAGTAEGTLRR